MVQRNQNIFRFFSADDKVIQCHWGQVNSVGSRLVIIDGVALSHEKLGKEPNLTTPCNFKIAVKLIKNIFVRFGNLNTWRCPFSSISSTLHFSKRTFEKITCSENRIGHTWGVFFERCFDRSLRNAPYMYHAAVERVFPRLDLRQFVQINVK